MKVLPLGIFYVIVLHKLTHLGKKKKKKILWI
jgi:hypothetical protein